MCASMHTFPPKIINNNSGSWEENVKKYKYTIVSTHTDIYIYKNAHTVQIVTHFCVQLEINPQ